MSKIVPNGAWCCVPTNLDLAGIFWSARIFDFEIICFILLDPNFLDFQTGLAWAGPGLGWAVLGLGPAGLGLGRAGPGLGRVGPVGLDIGRGFSARK